MKKKTLNSLRLKCDEKTPQTYCNERRKSKLKILISIKKKKEKMCYFQCL